MTDLTAAKYGQALASVNDQFQRPLQDLRISITDRCNFRCVYCMPHAEYDWIPRPEILTFEEIARLSAAFGTFGVRKIRLTGGEPLVRHGVADLVRMLVMPHKANGEHEKFRNSLHTESESAVVTGQGSTDFADVEKAGPEKGIIHL